MRIKTKLLLSFCLIIVIMFVFGAITFYRINLIQQKTTTLYEHPFAVSNRIRDFRESVQLMHKYANEIANTKNQAFLKSQLSRIKAEESKQLENLDVVYELYLGKKEEVTHLKELFKTWSDSHTNILTSSDNNFSKTPTTDDEQLLVELDSYSQKVLSFALKRANNLWKETVSVTNESFQIVAASIILSIIAAIILATLISITIISPISRMESFAQKLQCGLYKERIEIKRKDEMGVLAKVLNYMAECIQNYTEDLEQMVLKRTIELKQSNQRLQVSEQQLQATNQQLRASEQQLRASNQQLIASEQQLRASNQQIEQINEELIWKIDSLNCIKDFSDIFEENVKIEEALLCVVNLIAKYFHNSKEISVKISYDSLDYCSEKFVAYKNIIKKVLHTDKNKSGEFQIYFSKDYLTESQLMIIEIIHDRILDLIKKYNAKSEKETILHNLFVSSKLASIGELAAGVGHEINNPLTVILGQIELINSKHSPRSEEFERVISILKRAITRIANIVNSLRTYAHGIKSDDVMPFDAHYALKESLMFVEEIFRKENVVIELAFRARTSSIMGNFGRMQQVIVNLLTNAKDSFLGNGGIIRIETAIISQQLYITISDSGCGINQEDLDKIFDPFFTTKEMGKGTGLGLGISRSIIENMGGDIKVESTVGMGTSFIISLPLIDGNISEESHFDKPKNKIEGFYKILVVDDDEDFRTILFEHLSLLGFEIELANNGKQAIKKLELNTYDCVITDIKMPEVSGEELILQMHKLNRQEKIIVITGGVMSEYTELQRQVFVQESHGFIRKPFSQSELHKILLNVLKINS